jgi:hypothetical protein
MAVLSICPIPHVDALQMMNKSVVAWGEVASPRQPGAERRKLYGPYVFGLFELPISSLLSAPESLQNPTNPLHG